MADKLLAEWFWTDRWMGSSAFGLSIEVRGLYREMLTQAWRRGAQLPNNYDQIRRMTGVTKAEWRRAWPFVEKFWRVDGEALVNDTQLEIYADAMARSQRASERAVRAAQARHKQSLSTAQAQPEQCPPSLSLSPNRTRPRGKRAEVGKKPEYADWECPHVERHFNRIECRNATVVGRPLKQESA